ncbi:hypothetical protein [Stutzerimonas nitrititolerans]|uniref:hypothetical protein n=1 Tax=Stutzerimonas nitrititolerans TaxID=2482751 RepID=UPI0028B07917|nr:hypothetical protein [Stutzerimonas nitrititolerans]
MGSQDLEKVIRDCAKRGMSRNETRLMLGYSKYKMQLILSALPDVPWPALGASLGHLRGNASRRGICPASLARARQARRDNLTHTVRGVSGSITELARHFGIVSSSAARARVSAEGMTVEQAVTMPPRPSARDLSRQRKQM